MNGGPNMLYTDFNGKLLGLQGLIITNIEKTDSKIIIYAEMERKEHKCHCCGKKTNSIHDYRTQKIKDIPAFGKIVEIILRKRRYQCGHCGKRFYEDNTFLPRYYRMTNRLVGFVLEKLTDERSFTSVAREVNLSVSTVMRIFDLINYPKPDLPVALSIDEFKGNTNGEKYQCIITDPIKKQVLDILPKRYKPYLTNYFKEYSKEERNKVKYFVSDMWRTYADISDIWFRNSTSVIDRYHWIRQCIWAFENVRKEEQKKLSPSIRKYFKRSKSLLIKRYDSLDEENKQAVNVMLYYSVNISRAHWYKEQFLKIFTYKDPQKAKGALNEWIINAENCGIPQFEKCSETMRNWYKGITNSFYTPLTNGFTEGCNNKIKVLKRNAYGYKNFYRFRNRILHIFSHQKQQKEQAVA